MMAVNEFEFELNGDKVYTGNMIPETMPLSFTPYPQTKLRSLQDIWEIIKDGNRKSSRERWGQDKLINQGRRSSCNAYMAAAILMRQIWYATGKWVPLAPEFIYMLINGGRDAGSMLDDGMVQITDGGCCKLEINGERLIPYQAFKKSEVSMEHFRVATQDALNQRAGECYQFDKSSVEKCFHGMLDCIAGRGSVGIAVHVGDAYMRSGVVAGFDRGNGNHAICGDDVICLNDNPKSIEDFRISSPQSWGTKFADQGWTQITYRHIEGPMRFHGMYGMRSVLMSENEFSSTRLK